MKDAEDVIQLIQKNGLDPEAQEVRELFRKHGTTEFYEKVLEEERPKPMPTAQLVHNR